MEVLLGHLLRNGPATRKAVPGVQGGDELVERQTLDHVEWLKVFNDEVEKQLVDGRHL